MEGYFLISLSDKWLNLFEKKLVFDVYIDSKGKLVIISQDVIKN